MAGVSYQLKAASPSGSLETGQVPDHPHLVVGDRQRPRLDPNGIRHNLLRQARIDLGDGVVAVVRDPYGAVGIHNVVRTGSYGDRPHASQVHTHPPDLTTGSVGDPDVAASHPDTVQRAGLVQRRRLIVAVPRIDTRNRVVHGVDDPGVTTAEGEVVNRSFDG